VVEFALAVLAGLALDEQWRERRSRRGRRLRAYFLVASLASVGVLSIAAAALGGLPERLAAAVGVFAIALITYFALAAAQSNIAAGVFLIPLAVSFALQPTSREAFKGAPTRSELVSGTPTRRAVDRVLADLGDEPRVLTLVRTFPPAELALDLGFAGYGALAPRIQANGYDPMAPVSVRRVLGEMGARGFLTEDSLTPDIDTLRNWSIDAIQVQTADMLRSPGDGGFATPLENGVRRAFAVPFVRLKTITLAFDAVPRTTIDVSARVNGEREVLLGTLDADSTTRVLATPPYRVDAIVLVARAEGEGGSVPPRLTGIEIETQEGAPVQVSRLSAYLSQPAFLEIAPTPQIRVFRLIGTKPLVSGEFPIERDRGPHPGGLLTFHSRTTQDVVVALPFMPGWRGNVAITNVLGRIQAEAQAGATVRLKYGPRLFLPSLALAFISVLSLMVLGLRPKIAASLIKSRREEGK